MRHLEIIVASVADAVAAEEGGATRLEVVRDLARGGLTPSLEVVREIQRRVRLPLRVMLRESIGFTVSDEHEVARLCTAATELQALKVDGVVLGFAANGQVDLPLVQRILTHAPDLKATFHHAFETLIEPVSAIHALKALPQIDRILTWGGEGSWTERVIRLGQYAQEAAPEIAILIGGGVYAQVIRLLHTVPGLSEFHAGKAARTPATSDGMVDRDKVADLLECIR